MPYAVNTAVLREPHTHTSDPDGFFAWMSAVHLPDADSDDNAHATRAALRELFYGEPHTAHGPAYGYALEILCQRFGGVMDNSFWYPFGDSHLETVRQTLADLRVSFDPNDLLDSGAPIALPRIDDFPVIGHIPRPELVELAQTLAAADLSNITDAVVAGAIDELRKWATLCAMCADENFDLVCFHY